MSAFQDVTFSSSTKAAAATLLPVTMPAVVAANDILVAFVFGAAATGLPTGWTLAGAVSYGSADISLRAFTKIADGTEDGTTVNFNVSAGLVAGIWVWIAGVARYVAPAPDSFSQNGNISNDVTGSFAFISAVGPVTFTVDMNDPVNTVSHIMGSLGIRGILGLPAYTHTVANANDRGFGSYADVPNSVNELVLHIFDVLDNNTDPTDPTMFWSRGAGKTVVAEVLDVLATTLPPVVTATGSYRDRPLHLELRDLPHVITSADHQKVT